MPFFGVPIRNGLPIGLGSVAGFGVQQFDPSQLFEGGTVAGAWYDPSDLSTMFDTSSGTTPVAMPGLGAAVPVGLMLDKSQGATPGSELVTNGNFSSGTTGWSITGAWAEVGGQFVKTGASTATASQSILTVGRWYTFSINVVAVSTVLYIYAGSANSRQITTTGVQTFTLLCSGDTNLYVQCIGSDTATVDNISVRELPGNHAIAFNNTTARPELRARVNLLTYSEDFSSGGPWTKTSVTTTPNAGTNPIGGSNATRLQGTASNWFLAQTVSLTSLTPLVLSFWVKSNTGSSQTFRLFGTGTAQISSDLTATTDWQQFSFPYTPTNTAQQCGIIRNSSNSTADLLVWGADLRPANIGANVPAYQRIADALTYDTSGFPLYLRFDGIDDSMYTPANLNLSGTDKVSVFAGVRKLSDAARASLVELSASLPAGSFMFEAPDTAAARYSMRLRGNSVSAPQVVTQSVFSAPITNVLTGTYDIAEATALTEMQMRADGVTLSLVDNSGGATAGGGNFGTYPLFIGARNNSSLWLNGQIYSLIIAGSAVSAGNISATEQWVAQKTGLVIP